MPELDLNLLRVLTAIDDKRSISAAAIKLQRSQPSVSAALGRLRVFFGDPLFVRSGNRMQPTPRTVEIIGSVREVLSRHPLVRAHEPAGAAEGGDGATIVRL